MFFNPGLQWRFIKVDSQNVADIFPGAALKKETDETLFSYTQRYLYNCFNFAKLGIRSLEDLQELPANNGKMFLNGMYTDSYTCRVLFCRQAQPPLPVKSIALELEDFNADEVNTHFRPCVVDPGRKDVLVSYHGSNDLRRLSSKEHYNIGGAIRRQRQEQERKKRLGIE
ncbi:hypothetical protein RMATCC62417_14731 [Rhizopus microsporus]|nr:hypothetical protein RMATCC62417_14731 [Rhizopus microsporus]